MRTMIGAAVAAFLLAGCGGEAGGGNTAEAEATAAGLQPGEYELTTTVEEVRSSDDSTPATELKAGAPATTARACVAADGALDPAMFAEGEDQCSLTDS